MILEVNDVCKEYLQGKEPVPVLKHITFSAEEGSYVAIMGPSGSGKTTLMNILGCLDVQSSGSYRFDGQEIGAMTENQLAEVRNHSIGFVFQSFYLLPKLTAAENVALPLLYAGVSRSERRARAEAALRSVGLEERMLFRPSQLSGGQCQRAAIARAIVTRPKLLLADEPTGALDTASGRQVMEIFTKLNEEGITVVLITHEREIAEYARTIYHIRDGEMTREEGWTKQ